MRLQDAVVLLEPVLAADPYTGEQRPDWAQAPTQHSSAASVQPVSSTEAVLTAQTVISRWKCWLPPTSPLTPSWRVRWDGRDFTVDGEVEPWKLGFRLHHKFALLKRVDESG